MRRGFLLCGLLATAVIGQAAYEPPYVPPFTPADPPEDRMGKWGFPRAMPVTWTLGRGPVGLDRWALFDALQNVCDEISARIGAPGLIQMEMGPEEGGVWSGTDGVNWVYWTPVEGDAGACVENWGGNPQAWWRTVTADCYFNTHPSLGPINWRLCTGPTSDEHDIDICSVWIHELMHTLGAAHSEPCDMNHSVMSYRAPVCCHAYGGALAWDQIYLDRLHRNLDWDYAEDGNSHADAPVYIGDLAYAYSGLSVYDSYLYVMDHDFYCFGVYYDEQGPYHTTLSCEVDVGPNEHPTIKFTLRPQSGPETARTEYAYYNHPARVEVEPTGASGRLWEVHVRELDHWGTTDGQYYLTLELNYASQTADEGEAESAADGLLYRAYDLTGRLVYAARARSVREFRRQPGFQDRLARGAQGALFWRASRPEDRSDVARGRFICLRGGAQ